MLKSTAKLVIDESWLNITWNSLRFEFVADALHVGEQAFYQRSTKQITHQYALLLQVPVTAFEVLKAALTVLVLVTVARLATSSATQPETRQCVKERARHALYLGRSRRWQCGAGWDLWRMNRPARVARSEQYGRLCCSLSRQPSQTRSYQTPHWSSSHHSRS